MIHAPLSLMLFWLLAAGGVCAVLAAVFSGRLKPFDLLTAAEWKAALQLAGIFGLGVAIIYFQNGHVADRAAFIYGRF